MARNSKTKSKRGGARPGAGRKRKAAAGLEVAPPPGPESNAPASPPEAKLEDAPLAPEAQAPTDLSQVVEESKATVAQQAAEAEVNPPKGKRGRKAGTKNAAKAQAPTFGEATLQSVLGTPFQAAAHLTGVPEVELTDAEKAELASQAARAIEVSGVDLADPKLVLYGFILSFSMVALGRALMIRKLKRKAPKSPADQAMDQPHHGHPSPADPLRDHFEPQGLRLTGERDPEKASQE